ncbi:hypothetical protein [Gordonia spumicola]|uniref:hypothetical protein n=1 Tax=Gordonia spumicola TaxID=589161 RepID=UPI001379E9B8|nr:hypothetical protein [Gordonia spumicola]
MSTYGVVVISDLSSEESARALRARIVDVLTRQWREMSGSGPIDELWTAIVEVEGGARLTVSAPGMIADRAEREFFTGADQGRAVVCEDSDEYGVQFGVWKLGSEGPSLVYRLYAQDEEYEADQGSIARQVRGADAATRAARVFDVDPGALIDLDSDTAPVVGEIGFVGSPFIPLLNALNLQWPER